MQRVCEVPISDEGACRRIDVRKRALVVEEAQAVAAIGAGESAQWITESAEVEKLLHFIPSSNLTATVVQNAVRRATEFATAQTSWFNDFAAKRAEELLSDHRRVRDASGDRGKFAVAPILPVDVMGVFVLLPED